MSTKKRASPSITFEDETPETWPRIILKDQEGDVSAEFWIQNEEGGPNGLFVRDTDWDTGIYVANEYLEEFEAYIVTLLSKRKK